MAAECIVCFEETTDVLRPCDHAVCRACAKKWFANHEPVCPLCKRAVVVLPHVVPPPRGTTVCIRLEGVECTHVGITVCTCTLGGVRVLRVDPNDRAHHAGIRRGDVITHLNGIRVDTHETAVRIFNRATEGMTDSHCTVRRLPWWVIL